MTTIPASNIVNVVPSVLAAGESGVALNGLFLDTNQRIPNGQVLSFASQAAVGAYFGLSSTEYTAAGIYFAGYNGTASLPQAMLFSAYNLTPDDAFLRGASLSAVSLATLQTYSGSISVTVNGTNYSASPSLAAATSFSNAASIVGSALGLLGAQAASVTASFSGTTMTVTGVNSGSIATGGIIAGTGVTANTYVVGQLTGSLGGTGTYTVSNTLALGAITVTNYSPAVTFDSVTSAFVITSSTTGTSSTIGYASGTLGSSLLLTAAAGAVISQGAAASTPAATMAAIVAITTNFGTWTHLFDPDSGAVGGPQKQLFAAWNSTQNNAYNYVPWDTDQSPVNNNSAPASFGAIVKASSWGGTTVISANDYTISAFYMGMAASINFNQTNGRVNPAFKSGSGITPTVTTQAAFTNLQANGYNFYGAYGLANQTSNFFYPGTVSGPFQWGDSYWNQIWLNSSMQAAVLSLFTSARSVPYNTAGYAQIQAALLAPIQAAVNFGAINAGVVLSPLQQAEVNLAAGSTIATVLASRGWYLQVLPASAAVRAARTSPPATLWYMDGGSVQQLTLSSIEIQ